MPQHTHEGHELTLVLEGSFHDALGRYGRGDLAIDAAWQMAGGYARISDIDSGLYPQHAALRQFDAAGHYVGGGFVDIAPGDVAQVGLAYDVPPGTVPESVELHADPISPGVVLPVA